MPVERLRLGLVQTGDERREGDGLARGQVARELQRFVVHGEDGRHPPRVRALLRL
ncbi:ORFL167W [Human betaherpesvirus 5]|nr:ORFL167W [Human betaherpesvirus 5]QHX40507.1 ORFL167W [Human betaherpesvirus 5]